MNLIRKRARPFASLLVVIFVAYFFGWRNESFRAVVMASVFPNASVVDSGSVRLIGVVTARDVVVSAKVAGRIEKLSVDEGSTVREDEKIAILDSEESRSEITNQQAKISQLDSKLKQMIDVVVLENDRFKNQLERSTANLSVSESELKRSLAELDQARKDGERSRQLSEQGIISRSELDRAATGVQVAEAKTKSLRDQVSAARADYQLAETNGGQVKIATSDVEQTKAQLAQLRAQLEQVNTRLAYTEVRAPIAGVVSLRVASRGEVVKQGDPIVTIVDLDDIWVKTDVEESLMNMVSLGDRLSVELASGLKMTGIVIHIAPEADFATQRDVSRTKRDIRTYGIKVRLANRDRRIHPGMTAYVSLSMRSRQGGAPITRSKSPGQSADAATPAVARDSSGVDGRSK